MGKEARVGFGVIVLKEGKVLLGKRHDDPEKADSALHGEGCWTMPGGKLDFGETFEEGAKREVLEETNINLQKVEVIAVNQEILLDVHFITIGMLATKFSGEPQVMEPDEITKWEWFEVDNLPNPMYFPSEKLLKNYLEKKFYIA